MTAVPNGESQTTEAAPKDEAAEARKKIVDRVRKFRDKAADKSNEHESKLAAERADKLIKEHKITEEEIRGETPTDVKEFAVGGDFSSIWSFGLITGIALLFDGKALREKSVVIVNGEPTDVWSCRVICLGKDEDAVLYQFAYYQQAVEEVVKGRGYDMAEKNVEDSYRRGVVYALQQRFEAIKRRREPRPVVNTTTLVKTAPAKKEAEQFLEKKYTSRVQATLVPVDRTVFNHGMYDGNQIPMLGPETMKSARNIEKADEKNPSD